MQFKICLARPRIALSHLRPAWVVLLLVCAPLAPAADDTASDSTTTTVPAATGPRENIDIDATDADNDPDPNTIADTDKPANEFTEARGAPAPYPDMPVIELLRRFEVTDDYDALDPLLGPGPIAALTKPWGDTKVWLQQEHGLETNIYTTFLYQYATEVQAGKDNLFNNRTDVGLNWTALKIDDVGTTQFGVLMRSGHNLNAGPGENLSINTGSLYGINSLQGPADQESFTLNVLFFRQGFFEDKLVFTIGKLHPNAYIDLSSVANDESTEFLAGPFDGNSTIVAQGTYTPGLVLHYQPNDFIGFTYMGIDSLGTPQTGLSTLDQGDFTHYGQVRLTPHFKGLGKGNYRFVVLHSDQPVGSGAGVAFGFDQELVYGIVPFFRIGYTDPDVSIFEFNVSGGISILSPFGRSGDRFGFGVAHGITSRSALQDETLVEIFYRVQVTDTLQVSPDVQFLMNPARNPGEDFIAILGLRCRFEF